MSIIGMLAGMSATLAFIGGPILYRWLTVPQIFLLCAILAFIAWGYILIFLKEDNQKVITTKNYTFIIRIKKVDSCLS